jgi:hypothetical protein
MVQFVMGLKLMFSWMLLTRLLVWDNSCLFSFAKYWCSCEAEV